MRGLVLTGLIGAGGLIIGLLIGLTISQGFAFLQSGGTNIPYDQTHLDIANKITAFDQTNQRYLQLKHVQTGPAEFNPYAPLDAFTARETYTQSMWIWTCENDIDVTMCIWGAGNDGRTYVLDFGRHMANAVEITGLGHHIHWPKDSTQGYAIWVITL